MTAPTPAPTWEEFAAALKTALGKLGDGMVLVISSKTRPWVVAEFAQGRDLLYAEVSGELLGDEDVTRVDSPETRRILESHGWQPPDEAKGYMWHRLVPYPPTSAEYRAIAEGAVANLRDVNGLASPAELGYRAWEGLNNNEFWEVNLPGVEAQPLRGRRPS
ncbi:TY-Chap domain-containing protein [Dactylosporangium sp. NPDC051541]|uniref:TY-Chap domain-containing protein n=1 Tax=Dactylosporangium sp. NPDC051541 TaxID=3363977 RepID=UPI0037BA6D93